MCGINGICIKGQARQYVPNIASMNEMIRHRGPDDEGIYQDNDIALGHRRLSIIDLSKNAAQPMSNEDKTIWIVFNGEIYNFQMLRKQLTDKRHHFHSRSDTEVLVHGYEEWGVGLFDKLDGMFAFGLWDKKEKELLLVRDGCGIKPLFYWWDGQKLVFSSEIKGLLASGFVERTIHPQALSNYLSLFYIPSPETIIKNAKQVLPGSYIRFSFNHEPRHVNFWDLKNLDGRQATFTSEAQLYEQLREEIALTVKKSLISDVPVSLLLSAGLDSSIILHELKNLDQTDQIQTVTVGFNDPSYDESQVAKRFATELGFKNTTYLMQETDVPDMLENMVFHLDALNGNPCIFTEYFSFQHAAQKGKVTLTGTGNDEMLAGYSTYIADNYRRYYGILPYFLRKSAASLAQYLPTRDSQYSFDYLAQKFTEGSLFSRPKSHYWWRTIFSDDEKQRLFKREFLLDTPITLDAYPTYETHYSQVQDTLSFQDQTLYADFYRFLIDNANMKVDQLSMAFSLESRPSFLTKRFVEFVFSLPYNLKLKGSHTKHCLRQGYQNRLPDYILHRKKQGSIAPLGFLFKPEMRELLVAHLFSNSLAEFFDLDYIKFLLERQIDGVQNNSYKIFALFIFAIWEKQFIDRTLN